MLPEAAAYKKEWQAAQQARLDSGVDTDSFVYLHVNEDDGVPHHVGIGFKKGRPWDTGRNSKHRNKAKKHGLRVEIVADNLTWEQACFWEVHWIKALRAAGYELTNLTDGGEGARGYFWSDELKDRHRKILNRPETVAKRNATNSSPEFKSLRAKKTSASWQDEDVRNRRIEGIRVSLNSSDYKEKRAATDALPEVIKRRSEANKEAQNRPVTIEKKKSIARAQFDCPEKRLRHKKAMENPELRAKISQNKKGIRFTEAQKQNISAGQQKHQDAMTPERRAEITTKRMETRRRNGTLDPNVNRTKEQMAAVCKKGWETRHKNSLLKKGER